MNRGLKRMIITSVFGSCLAVTGIVMATGESIPKIASNVKIEFDNVEKKLPPSYEILHYNNRIYVPLRFIAEELGAEVVWDDRSKKVNINKVEEKRVDQNSDESRDAENSKVPDEKMEKDSSTAEKLPISKVTKEGIVVTIKSITNFTGLTSISLKVTNTSDDPINLSQVESFFTIDHSKHKGEKFKVVTYEQGWYQNIEKDDKKEGSLVFAYIPKDAKELNLHLTFNTNHGFSTNSLQFNIDLNNSIK